MFQKPVTDEYTGRFYMHFGFIDPATQFPSLAAGVGQVSVLVALLVVGVAHMLLM